MVSGTYRPFGDTINTIAALTGHKLRFATLPASVLAPVVRLMDVLQFIAPFRMPTSREGFDTLIMDAHCDDSQTIAELGIETSSFEDTMTDMIRWMHQSGGISTKLAGKLAD